MGEVVRLEVWTSHPAMLWRQRCLRLYVMVVVFKQAVAGSKTKKVCYRVAFTADHQVIKDWLETGGDPDQVPLSKMTHDDDYFGFYGAAEKYAARLLTPASLRYVVGNTGKDGDDPKWEPLYDGPLTIAKVPRPMSRFPPTLEDEDHQPVLSFNTGVIEGETLEDFRERRAAYRRAQKAQAGKAKALEGLAEKNRVIVRTTEGTPPKVVGMTVSGLLPSGEIVRGELRRVATAPPRSCEIEAPSRVTGHRVAWTLNGKLIGVSNG